MLLSSSFSCARSPSNVLFSADRAFLGTLAFIVLTWVRLPVRSAQDFSAHLFPEKLRAKYRFKRFPVNFRNSAQPSLNFAKRLRQITGFWCFVAVTLLFAINALSKRFWNTFGSASNYDWLFAVRLSNRTLARASFDLDGRFCKNLRGTGFEPADTGTPESQNQQVESPTNQQ